MKSMSRGQFAVYSHRMCLSLRGIEMAWNKFHNVQPRTTSPKSSIWGEKLDVLVSTEVDKLIGII